MSSNASDKRIGCNPARAVFTTDNRKEWEQWIVEPKSPGLVAIKSQAHNNEERFLTAQDDGTLTMDQGIYFWRVDPSSYGGVRLCSSTGNKFLMCTRDEDGVTLTLEERGDDKSASWTLEPRMPHTISANQIWSMLGASFFGLTIVAVTPLAVVGIVGTMGFGSGGIVTGSAAAGMMSAEVIAGGGGVVAGGTVATLQSIGAAGLGVAGTSAAMAGGALVRGSVVGGTGLLVFHPDGSSHQHSIAAHSGRCRPFAGWRYW